MTLTNFARKCHSVTTKLRFNFVDYPQVKDDGATVASATVAAVTGLTIGAPSVTSPKVTVTVGGGTAGEVYTLECHATFSDGQTDCMKVRLAVD